MKKKLGVIGGLGTDTAAQFYVETERFWHRFGEKNHIPLMLENVQSPFSLEQSLTRTMKRVDELKKFLCQAALNLEHGGTSLIALPCNTAHVHIEAVRDSVKIPMLSITEEVARHLKNNDIKSTTILGTKITRESKIYEDQCHKLDITVHYPSTQDQLAIQKVIQRALSWQNDIHDQEILLDIIQRSKDAGSQSVVLACTDLQLCMPSRPVEGVFDSMKILAEASVKELLRQ